MTASKRLLAWYDRCRRDLPWRRSPADPYPTLVSEFMLQQTRVDTVIPFYERFLLRFPSAQSLAEASEEDVLVHWSGLGYYRRATQLHQAVRAICSAGGFPTTLEGLRALPGIGEYTAAAVASIAFGVAAAAVDGNVVRLQSRRLGLRDAGSAAARARVRAAAQELLDPRRPGDSNQAMMELGATVCLPREPACPRCPLRLECAAAEAGRPEEYPAPRRRRPSERLELLAALVRRPDGRVLVVRRPSHASLLAGTWELPWVAAQGAAASALAARYGGRWSLGETLCEVRHTITHRLLRVALRAASLESDELVSEGAEARWASAAELRVLPRSSLLDKLLGRAARG